MLCENCEKSGHECVFVPQIKTRRRKRADARVTELEKEVRALAGLLRQGEDDKRYQLHQSPPSDSRPDFSSSLQAYESTLSGTNETLSKSTPSSDANLFGPVSSNVDDIYISNRPISTLPTSKNPPVTGLGDQDVIDRGILDWEVALQLFGRYQFQLAPCYPIVPLTDTTSPKDIRRKSPVLFLAIIAAAAAVSPDKLRDALHDEILQTYASHVMTKGIKSLELLQAMLITIAWYRPCGSYNDTKYLQYTQAASLMAHELNLGKPTGTGTVPYRSLPHYDHNAISSQIGYDSWSVHDQLHSDGIERYRTLLAAFIQSST